MSNYDPDHPTEEMMYHCQMWARKMLNPIIDWTEEDVWEFIDRYKIPYCELYDQGFDRLGCIGCPMGTVAHRQMEFERWPKYKQAYIRAFQRMIDARSRGGTTTQLNRETNSAKNGEMTISENSTTGSNKGKKNIGGGSEDSSPRMVQESGCDEGGRRKVRVLDEQKGVIEIHEKKIVGLPKWGDDSAPEDVMDWWIR